MDKLSATIIDQQFVIGNELIDYLNNKNEITLSSEAENNFRKNILLSSASFFEKTITELVIEFVTKYSKNNDCIISLVKQKAVKRQYHTYFDWDKATNANGFFALFGEEFKAKMAKMVKDNAEIDNSIKAFLQIGQERNKLVHQNFAEIVLDKTAEEIYKLYKEALGFVRVLISEFKIDFDGERVVELPE